MCTRQSARSGFAIPRACARRWFAAFSKHWNTLGLAGRKNLVHQLGGGRPLRFPLTLDMAQGEDEWSEQNQSVLQRMGVGLESVGPDTFKIDSLPSFLDVPDAAQFMRKVIDDLKTASNSASPMRLGEEMIAKSVC